MADWQADLIRDDPEAREHFRANPEQVAERPELPSELNTYWRAWNRLRDDRMIGAMGGAGRIYYTAISQYCRDHGIAGPQFQMFVRFIEEMDDEYLKAMAEQRPASETETP
jgi:hypothetical protein